MRRYTKILAWENKRRLNKLIEFRQLVIDYFSNTHVEWPMDTRIEEDAAQMARIKINQAMHEVHSIIRRSGIDPNLTVLPAPAVGGYVRKVDLILNIFGLDEHATEPNRVLDIIERAIGIYESNHKLALVRTFNPFFYVGWFLDVISDLPFVIVGKFGFDQRKMKTSLIGKFVKGIMFLAPFLTILHLFGFLEPVKQFVHKLLGYGKAN